MDNKIKHLEMIQTVINRMSNNSFMLKGWTVTLVAGIYALSAKDADKMFFLVAYLPILIFWFLDAYYLWQEKIYRCLYDEIRIKSNDEIDFDMNTYKIKSSKNTSFCRTMLSITVVGFYVPLALFSTGIVLISLI